MARPMKSKLSYFQHDVNRGKTVAILRSQFGNDGYAFWFGLLEMLGNSDGTYIDLKEVGTLDYLSAWCNVTSEKATEMLDVLASLLSIDKELYQNHNIIWCQKFIDRLDHLHTRRQYTPTKPNPNATKGNGVKTPALKNVKTPALKNVKTPAFEGVKPVPVRDVITVGKFNPDIEKIEDAHPDFDVKHSFTRFKDFNESKGRELTKTNWEWWWQEDLNRGKYKKPKDPNRMVTIECPLCDYKVGVKYADKDGAHFCKKDDCGIQLAYGNTLIHERAHYSKQAK